MAMFGLCAVMDNKVPSKSMLPLPVNPMVLPNAGHHLVVEQPKGENQPSLNNKS